MSWIKVVNALVVLNDVKDAYGEVKSVYDYGKKIEKADPTKLTWDDVKFFDNPVMNAALKAAKTEQAKAKAAESAKLEMPKCDSLAAWLAATKAMAKYGKDSKQFKDAMKKYIAILKAYDKDLADLLKQIGKVSVEMFERKTLATTMESYAKLLEKAFQNCAKIPNLGTSQNAMFFTLSRDAANYAKMMKPLAKSYDNLFKMARTHSMTVDTEKKNNLEWIKASEKDVFTDEKAMSKNTKAVLPKK